MKYYLSLVIIVILGYYTIAQCFEYWDVINSANDVIEVSGVLNMWGMYSVAIVCPLSAYSGIRTILNRPFKKPVDKWIYLIALVIAPLMTYVTNQELNNKIEDYIECRDDRVTTLRYISRTYAISPELCEQQ